MEKPFILKESVYVTADGKSLAKKDAQHKILLGHAGHSIPHESAKLLGLLKVEEKEGGEAVEDKGAEPAETKSARKGKGK